ncbi:low-density lipoprotein receptor-related protein 5-like [Mytilus californianus]|uniref:low-density lipoprotein receptor-related protein 5-like n=1 Tax=Mytilus californianus TaxID=6549 RepID=UPI002247CA8C|nr:low-density lipoprotein receptor-related protein 5-like [Mytilus californianus]
MDVQIWLVIPLEFYFLPMIRCTKVLIGTKVQIKEIDVDTGNVKILVNDARGEMYGMDYDYKFKYMYFTRYHHRSIMRFPYPTENPVLEKFIDTGSGPTGLAIDSEYGHVYWTEYNTHRLRRCNVNGSNAVIIASNLKYPFSIRLSLVNRWMYVVERFKRIIKARFNYSESHGIVDLNTRVDYMDLDINEDKLYWTTFYQGDLKSASVRGCDVKTLFQTGNAKYYQPIDVYGSSIFYSSNQKLLMSNTTQGTTSTELYTDTYSIFSIYVHHQTAYFL